MLAQYTCRTWFKSSSGCPIQCFGNWIPWLSLLSERQVHHVGHYLQFVGTNGAGMAVEHLFEQRGSASWVTREQRKPAVKWRQFGTGGGPPLTVLRFNRGNRFPGLASNGPGFIRMDSGRVAEDLFGLE